MPFQELKPANPAPPEDRFFNKLEDDVIKIVQQEKRREQFTSGGQEVTTATEHEPVRSTNQLDQSAWTHTSSGGPGGLEGAVCITPPSPLPPPSNPPGPPSRAAEVQPGEERPGDREAEEDHLTVGGVHVCVRDTVSL